MRTWTLESNALGRVIATEGEEINIGKQIEVVELSAVMPLLEALEELVDILKDIHVPGRIDSFTVQPAETALLPFAEIISKQKGPQS